MSITNAIDTSILNETPPSAEDEGLLIPYRDGSHGSVKIIMDDDESGLYSTDSKSALSIEDFQNRLLNTIEICKQLNKKSLWIQVPMSKARYIEACTDIPGLEFHHAEGDTAHLALWLKQDIENKIPEYATHQVGVGAIVVNSNNEILCVRELRKNFRKWKIPGGLAELGEQLDTAAIREVKEETGIDCRFKSVLGFRHSHSAQFGRSDMYFVCRLEPIEDDGTLQQPVAQKEEIAAAAWVPLQDYKDMINGKDDDGSPHPMMQKMMELHDLDWEQSDIQMTVVNSIVPGRKPSPIYHAPGSYSS
jgi:ADP-ribose pyrophosphatase YjhB (NUDIX family)